MVVFPWTRNFTCISPAYQAVAIMLDLHENLLHSRSGYSGYNYTVLCWSLPFSHMFVYSLNYSDCFNRVYLCMNYQNKGVSLLWGYCSISYHFMRAFITYSQTYMCGHIIPAYRVKIKSILSNTLQDLAILKYMMRSKTIQYALK